MFKCAGAVKGQVFDYHKKAASLGGLELSHKQYMSG